MDSRETDAVIRNLSAFAFLRQIDLRTEAMAASYKISKTSFKDFCFVCYDVMLPWWCSIRIKMLALKHGRARV